MAWPARGSGVAVVPGDDVTVAIKSALAAGESAAGMPPVSLGTGLRASAASAGGGGQVFTTTRAGVLRFKAPALFWVDSNRKRYVPATGDTVIGVVSERMTEFYRVRLNASSSAQLPVLAFQGASKRNRPDLNVGTLVYARVVLARKELEPQLTCEAASSMGVVKDWMTGESIFGELKGGYALRCSQSLARRLLDPACPVLAALGAAVPFEMAVGANGVVWVKAGSARDTVVVASAIKDSEFLDAAAATSLVARLLGRAPS